mmetsp:Transcript_93902/g.265703  ORF Transcript_93902/g.265703 Transcript_93902/m.265703 type:complete len:616 (-) Transcript_93902:62-1909(-)
MNFSSYFFLSTLVVIGIIAHAYVAHEQFYPAVVYLSTDKMCLAVFYNFAFALFLLFGKILLRIFIGTLRDLEVEQLVDSGRGFLADTILFLVFYAPTIDNREVGTVYLIQYICCVIFMKVFHLTTQIRVSHMFEVGVPRLIVNLKLVGLMALLLGCDLLALQYFYSVASRSSTFFTWILFEALTMSTVVLVSICKYSVHMVDLRLDNGWPGKSVCLFYIDLVHDVVSMTLFLVFMLTFFVQNPSRLPIYMMADVIQVARKLAQRLRSFRRYRRISLNMEMRFPDATDEEIEQNEHCVICRDSLFEGSKPKKLPCSHIFHIDCLRSWLVMQQVCPTCRAEIPAEVPSMAAPMPAAAARDGHPPPAGAPVAPVPSAPGAAAAGAQPAAAAAASPAAPASASAAPTEAGAPAAAQPMPGAAVPPTLAATAALPRAAAVGEMPAAGQAFAVPGALPPVAEIMESLRRAEEIAKFLRQQTEFWMDQVRQIEQGHSQPGASGIGVDGTGLPLTPPQWSNLSAGAMGGVAAQAAMSMGSAMPHPAMPAGLSSGSNGAADAVGSEFLGQVAPHVGTGADCCAAGCGAGSAGSEGDSPSGHEACGQMEELRRAQQEQWERRRQR